MSHLGFKIIVLIEHKGKIRATLFQEGRDPRAEEARAQALGFKFESLIQLEDKAKAKT